MNEIVEATLLNFSSSQCLDIYWNIWLEGTNIAHIFDVRTGGEGGQESFMKKSIFCSSTHTSPNIPSRDSVVDIKEGGEKGKFKYEKNM